MLKIIFPVLAVFFAGLILACRYLFAPARAKSGLDKFSYLNSFPCEMAYANKERNWLFSLVTLFVAASLFTYASNITEIGGVIEISALILYALSAFCFLGLFIVGLDNYRIHLGLTIVYVIGQIGGNAMLLAYYFFYLQTGIVEFYVPEIGIGTGILALIQIILLFIPQLKKWMYLEKSEQNGKTFYLRPRFNALASLEWFFFFSQIILMIIFIINGSLVYTM